MHAFYHRYNMANIIAVEVCHKKNTKTEVRSIPSIQRYDDHIHRSPARDLFQWDFNSLLFFALLSITRNISALFIRKKCI